VNPAPYKAAPRAAPASAGFRTPATPIEVSTGTLGDGDMFMAYPINALERQTASRKNPILACLVGQRHSRRSADNVKQEFTLLDRQTCSPLAQLIADVAPKFYPAAIGV